MVVCPIKVFLPALGASLLLAACGRSSSSSTSGSSSAAPAASGTTVKTASVSSVDSTVLVDSQGLTLYHLTGEHAGKFICTSSACLAAWHPLTVSSGSKPSGSVSSLGVVKRDLLPSVKDPVAFALMRDLKQLLDPKGILNPGKVL